MRHCQLSDGLNSRSSLMQIENKINFMTTCPMKTHVAIFLPLTRRFSDIFPRRKCNIFIAKRAESWFCPWHEGKILLWIEIDACQVKIAGECYNFFFMRWFTTSQKLINDAWINLIQWTRKRLQLFYPLGWGNRARMGQSSRSWWAVEWIVKYE